MHFKSDETLILTRVSNLAAHRGLCHCDSGRTLTGPLHAGDSPAGGLMLSALRLPRLSPLFLGQRPDWLTPYVILIVFLPALVFEGSLKC